jgi:hypothetical protein
MGSVGEYGLNVNNGNIASPQTTRDFMAYGGVKWISPYHYGLLLSNDRLNPTTVGVDTPWWKDLVWEEVRFWPIPEPDPPFHVELPMLPPSLPQDVVSLIVKVERGRVDAVLHVARTRAHTALPGAVETPFTARLRDARDAVVAEGRLLRLRTAASGCGCGGHGEEPTSYLAQAFLPDAAPGAKLELVDGDEVVWDREAPAEPPRAELADAKVDRRGNATVSWESSGGVDEFWLRWSRDGEDWRSVATGLTRRRARIPAGQLPPGNGLLQVVAHDGFFSSYSRPRRIAIPDRPAEAVILHPVDGHTYAAGQTIRLWASVVDPSGQTAADEAVWLVDRKEVARGLDAFVTLEPGKRTVTLRLGDGGRPASVSVTVTE